MKRYMILIAGLLVFAFLFFVHAKTQRETEVPPVKSQPGLSASGDRTRAQLEKLLSPLSVDARTVISSGGADSYLEAQVAWNAYVGAPDFVDPAVDKFAKGSEFTIVKVRTDKGALPNLRSIELSQNHLFVAALDAQARLLSWALIQDPRILRAERADATGRLSGKLLHHSTPLFTVALADAPGIVELRFYHPDWTGKEFVLEALGSAAIRR